MQKRVLPPKEICIILTYRCNAKCNMCNVWHNPTNAIEEITVKYIKKLPSGLRFINPKTAINHREPRKIVNIPACRQTGNGAGTEVCTVWYIPEKHINNKRKKAHFKPQTFSPQRIPKCRDTD